MRQTNVKAAQHAAGHSPGHSGASISRQHKANAICLQTLLCRVAGSVKVTREHDLVYAFLGFQDLVHPIRLTVNADRYNVPLSEAYNRAAKALMEQIHNLEPLGLCGDEGSVTEVRTDGFASGPSNWKARLPQGRPLYWAGMDQGNEDWRFHASKALLHISTYTAKAHSQLIVRGRIVDAKATFGTQDFNVKTLLEAHSEDSVIRRARQGDLGLVPPTQEEAYKIVRRQSLTCVRNMLFIGVTSRLGLAPQHIKAVDAIVFLNGSRVPVVRRKIESDADQVVYRVIDQTYSEEAKYGEFADWKTDAEADIFVLVWARFSHCWYRVSVIVQFDNLQRYVRHNDQIDDGVSLLAWKSFPSS